MIDPKEKQLYTLASAWYNRDGMREYAVTHSEYLLHIRTAAPLMRPSCRLAKVVPSHNQGIAFEQRDGDVRVFDAAELSNALMLATFGGNSIAMSSLLGVFWISQLYCAGSSHQLEIFSWVNPDNHYIRNVISNDPGSVANIGHYYGSVMLQANLRDEDPRR